MLDGVDDDASACMLDELAAAFKKTFPPRSGLTAPARAVLVSLAQSFTLGIAEIEARHAATQRITSVVGCQTHVPSLISVSASWVCRRNAAERQSVDLFRRPNADQPDATEDALVDDEPAAVDGRSAGRLCEFSKGQYAWKTGGLHAGFEAGIRRTVRSRTAALDQNGQSRAFKC